MSYTRRQFLLYTALATLTACSSQAKHARIAKNSTVVALGDSLTEGFGASVAYPTVLQQLTGRMWLITAYRATLRRILLTGCLKHYRLILN